MTPATARSHRTTTARGAAVPRRVSGAVRRPTAVPGAATAVPRRRSTSSPPRIRLAAVRALPEHRVVDRLLRSRLWIWALGVMLGGIVTMQVSLLKLNSGISRAVETSATLERQNGDLEARIASLSATDHVQQGALQLGMVMPAAGDVSYLTAHPGDPARAVAAMRPPSADAVALLANHGIVPGSPAAASQLAQAASTPVATNGAPATASQPSATTTAAATAPPGTTTAASTALRGTTTAVAPVPGRG